MKIRSLSILFSMVALVTQHTLCDHIITFFMRPFPHLPGMEKKLTNDEITKKSKKLRNPKKIAQYTLRSLQEGKTAHGIFCTYNGQLAFSNIDGQVNFKRQQEQPNVNLLITLNIKPVFMAGRTIHHWELVGGAPAERYLVTRQKDKGTAETFWHVQKTELPEDNRIALDTIVIFSKPHYIIVPEGITLIEQDPQLILPDLYVKKNIDKLSSGLYVLSIKRYFEQTKESYKKREKDYSLQLY